MKPWHHSANFYHIYPLGLCGAPFRNDYGPAEPRLWQIADWLPHIRAMGCNAVYLGPVFKSVSHGYDCTDYLQVDNRLGDNETLHGLARLIHENGLRLVLDGVFNHCGRDFFAFQDLLKNGPASAYRDWFSGLDFTRPNPLGDPFSYDTWAGYHELVKFNLQHREVKDYLFKTAAFWMDHFHIDGLRLDAADCLDFDFMRELRAMTSERKADFWLMGEVLHGDYSRWANPQTLHSVTNYAAYKGLYSSHNDQNPHEIAHTLNRQFREGGSCSGFLPYNFADNHDLNRLASTVMNPAYLYTIYMLLYTMPGLPSLYYGSEWGIKGVKAGGSDAAIRPALNPESVEGKIPELEAAIKMFSAIRNSQPALQGGEYRQLLLKHGIPFVFERTMGKERIIVALNISGQDKILRLPDCGGDFTDLLSGEQARFDGTNGVTVYKHWGRILKQNA